MLRLPSDPDPAEVPGLPETLRALVSGLAATERGCMPRVEGLPWTLLARWLYRAWLGQRWRPLVCLDAAWLGRERMPVLREAIAQATGGWLILGAEDPGLELQALLESPRVDGLCALHEVARITVAQSLIAPAGWVERLVELDHQHLVAVDPGLRLQRLALGCALQGEGPVNLRGPVGSGRRSLVDLARRGLPAGVCIDLYLDPSRLESRELARLYRALCRDRAEVRLIHEGGSAPPHPTARAFAGLRGQSPAWCRLLAIAARVAPTAQPVLLVGEPGVGKRQIARAIHGASGNTGAYVEVDLGRTSEALVQQELFGDSAAPPDVGEGGHREPPRAGALRFASGGTLYLRDIDRLSIDNQARLRAALEGSNRSLSPRILSSSGVDLQLAVSRGELRADLRDHLGAVELFIPPLRDRPEDIQELAHHLLGRPVAGGSVAPAFSLAAQERLRAWPWPGNVEELREVVSAAAEAAGEGLIEPLHLVGIRGRSESPGLLLTLCDSPEDPATRSAFPRWMEASQISHRIEIPPLRDRGAASIRSALLTLLDGHPIRGEALELLEQRAWWGELSELREALEAVKARTANPIDRSALRRFCPALLGEDRFPFLLRENGGPLQEYAVGALLLTGPFGLAGALSPEPTTAPRPRVLRLPGGTLLHDHPLLLDRFGGGLRLRAPRGGHPLLVAGPLGGREGALRPIDPDGTELGPAGLVVFRDARPARSLSIELFAGAVVASVEGKG